MSYKKDELLGYLITAIELMKSLIERIPHAPIKLQDISSVLENIEKAKSLASPRDRPLIEELESSMKRLIGTKMTSRNIKEIRAVLRQFGSEVYMGRVVADYSDHEYNLFLRFLEKPRIKEHIADLRLGGYKMMSKEERKSMLDLKIIEERDGEIRLTEKGEYLAMALANL